MKSLITYFSASGVTKNAAQNLAKAINADLFEIEPVQKYTDADLDWTDKTSRTTLEMADKSSRPQIKNKVQNLQDYDSVVIGFPVWWYTAPTIINTFIEENNLEGKNIYVFVTSGGSGAEDSFNHLKAAYPKLKFIACKRLRGNENAQKLDE